MCLNGFNIQWYPVGVFPRCSTKALRTANPNQQLRTSRGAKFTPKALRPKAWVPSQASGWISCVKGRQAGALQCDLRHCEWSGCHWKQRAGRLGGGGGFWGGGWLGGGVGGETTNSSPWLSLLFLMNVAPTKQEETDIQPPHNRKPTRSDKGHRNLTQA